MNMKKAVFHTVAALIVTMGVNFGAQASDSELNKQRQILDTAITNLKSNITSCRAKINQMRIAGTLTSVEGLKSRLECRTQNDAYIGTIIKALAEIGNIHDQGA